MLYAGTPQLAAAVALFAIGWWGRRKAHVLVHHRLPEDAKLKRIRTMRRGGTACQVVGALFVVGAFVPVVVG